MRTKKTMKLMSWNIGGRTDKKVLGDQLSKIKNENADILALQEVKPKILERFKKELAESGLKYLKTAPVIQRKDSVLIACRWPWEPVDMIERPWRESVLSAIIRSPYGEIEIHTVHVPNGSKNRQQKIDTFNGIYGALSRKSKRHRILCGDFNSPDKEFVDKQEIITFDEENEKCDPIKGKDCERKVICGLADWDLKDTYLQLPKHKTCADEYSHIQHNKGKVTRRRLDHIFSSDSLNPKKCGYLHSLRKGSSNKGLCRYEKGDLSDHSPIYAIYEPEAS